jgi:hypothetical protein
MKWSLFLIFVLTSNFNSYSSEIVMKHMLEGKNCIICHEANTPKKLLLRNGVRINLSQVDELCGQCHGIKHRGWREGRHGKVITSWKSDSQKRISCIVCHDPHSPKFKQMQAKEPPELKTL